MTVELGASLGPEAAVDRAPRRDDRHGVSRVALVLTVLLASGSFACSRAPSSGTPRPCPAPRPPTASETAVEWNGAVVCLSIGPTRVPDATHALDVWKDVIEGVNRLDDAAFRAHFHPVTVAACSADNVLCRGSNGADISFDYTEDWATSRQRNLLPDLREPADTIANEAMWSRPNPAGLMVTRVAAPFGLRSQAALVPQVRAFDPKAELDPHAVRLRSRTSKTVWASLDEGVTEPAVVLRAEYAERNECIDGLFFLRDGAVTLSSKGACRVR
jgi:hypothetical protein